MKDVGPGHSYPTGAGVVVAEGGELGDCGATTPLQAEEETVNFLNDNRYTVTEVSIYSGCGTEAYYLNTIRSMESYIEKHGKNPGSHWLGFMLDEESGYGFSPGTLTTLNQAVLVLMAAVPGYSYFFTEDAVGEGDWTTAEYEAVIAGSFPAPQVYNSFMVGLVNRVCRQVVVYCTNLVTADPTNSAQTGYPYDNGPADAKQIIGPPYQYGDQGPGYYNLFYPA
jgi:hypothetical protein